MIFFVTHNKIQQITKKILKIIYSEKSYLWLLSQGQGDYVRPNYYIYQDKLNAKI